MPEKTIGTRILEMPYWYHHIELPDGNVTPGWAPIDASKYGIPDDLTGKRILDIGAWDGYWTWEALKRGAKEVVAIDDFSDNLGSLTKEQRPHWETFDLCREAFGFTEPVGFNDSWKNEKGQFCSRIETSIYDIQKFGRFDIVFFFGTVYHLKYPLLAFEKISAICDGEIYIESAICDDYSPYRGGIDKGYPNHDVICEFYPQNQYGGNVNNWWVPTLQCLGMMAQSVGFKNIQTWPLTENAKELPQCRGFMYGSKTGKESPNVSKLVNSVSGSQKELSIAAVMSVPRLGFMDNLFCVFQGLIPNKIPLIKVSGAFWGACLERGIQSQIDETDADAILTIDYDTIFTPDDVNKLVRLMIEHPEADAIVPMQVGRSGMNALLSMKSKSGEYKQIVPITEFSEDLTKISTGHFGLTLLRTSSLLKLPHPWFLGEPNSEGRWGEGRIDDDIHFWRQMEKAGMNVYSANRIVLGHLQVMATWPNEELKVIYQIINDYEDKGKPANIWK